MEVVIWIELWRLETLLPEGPGPHYHGLIPLHCEPKQILFQVSFYVGHFITTVRKWTGAACYQLPTLFLDLLLSLLTKDENEDM